MTPLGQGILTGMAEVDDPTIRDAMDKMLAGSARTDVNQTVLDLAALTMALCGALGECSDTPAAEVLDCVLFK